jgi:hypothetical protein
VFQNTSQCSQGEWTYVAQNIKAKPGLHRVDACIKKKRYLVPFLPAAPAPAVQPQLDWALNSAATAELQPITQAAAACSVRK